MTETDVSEKLDLTHPDSVNNVARYFGVKPSWIKEGVDHGYETFAEMFSFLKDKRDLMEKRDRMYKLYPNHNKKVKRVVFEEERKKEMF